MPEKLPEDRGGQLARDRAEMVKRALIKAGYLPKNFTSSAPGDFRGLAAGLMADLLHLAEALKIPFGPDSAGQALQMAQKFYGNEGGHYFSG